MKVSEKYKLIGDGLNCIVQELVTTTPRLKDEKGVFIKDSEGKIVLGDPVSEFKSIAWCNDVKHALNHIIEIETNLTVNEVESMEEMLNAIRKLKEDLSNISYRIENNSSIVDGEE